MTFLRAKPERVVASVRVSTRGRAPEPDLLPAGLPPSGRYVALDTDKLRGGYYTPAALAAWMCRWAVRDASDSVLEPSCGDGVFVAAAAARLRALGAAPAAIGGQLRGVELVPAEADKARARLADAAGDAAADAAIITGEFFAWWAGAGRGRYAAVLGNPPFIRYQSFPEPARGRAMALMTALGLRPNRLTNIWAPFVVAAAEAVAPGGRMALVVPAELLQVSYATQLRAFLTERFATLTIVACNELIFENAQQEVILLLADGALPDRRAGHVCQVVVVEAPSVADLLARDPDRLRADAEPKDVRGGREKWLKYFLTSREIALLRALRDHPRIVPLGRLAEVDVGIVTGANEVFVLAAAEIAGRCLDGMTRRLVSKSAQLRGSILGDAEWQALAAEGARVHLLDIRPDARGRIPLAARDYVAAAERRDLHRGYKCRIRSPWYQVPAIWSPDAFLFRQIHDFPRLVLNEAGATSTDTIHRVRVRGGSAAALVAGGFTHLTAASAEIEGRSYGGGVLELEPTEAETLLFPDAAALAAALPLAEADRLIRDGRLAALLMENDRLVLRGALGLSEAECVVLREAWSRMKDRRTGRRRRPRVTA